MVSQVYGADVHGIEGRMIQIEADVTDGLPIFSMVGYLSSAVKEAKERVCVALKNAGVHFPAKRITINLSPADVRKEGTSFDLSIAVALLAAFGHLSNPEPMDTVFLGEVNLNGELKPVHGVLSMVMEAKKHGLKRCVLPKANAKEGGMVEGIMVYGAATLREVILFLQGEIFLEKEPFQPQQFLDHIHGFQEDFSDVIGQESAKEAIELAVSGMHNIMIVGPPGTGKTMLARRIPTIMPALSYEESVEITKIYSVCGLLSKDQGLINLRPFRSPHPTITPSALVGGGRHAKPGEISLATGGVLFLDEFFEFKRTTMELLRQPMEDGLIWVNRLDGSYEYPSDMMVVAAANPCRCGYFPDQTRCTCTPYEISTYLSRVSKPVLDRIDISTETVILPSFSQNNSCKSTKDMKERVALAQKIQKKRYQKENIHFNSQLTPSLLKKYCPLQKEEKSFLDQLYQGKQISIRGVHRMIKVARTIADLSGDESITVSHLAKAMRYRGLELEGKEGCL